jgi:hypothetical protein
MTYNTDPSRWSDSLGEAPDVLRAPFAAARNEAPSDLQMKALALKLAALSAGTAAAATAATAKAAASTTAGGGAVAASAGTFSVAKVAVSVALFGATLTGAVVWQGKLSVRQGNQQAPAAQVAHEAPLAHETSRPAEQKLQNARLGTNAVAPASTSAAVGGAPSIQPDAPAAVAPTASNQNGVTSPADESSDRTSVRSSTSNVRSSSSSARTRQGAVKAPSSKSSVSSMPSGAGSTAGASEVDLLRQARAALASRPREAFAITQSHRQQYPQGVFAQERDALAIEALMRAGEMGTARSLAERFVREHPSSPHTHRFNETILR